MSGTDKIVPLGALRRRPDEKGGTWYLYFYDPRKPDANGNGLLRGLSLRTTDYNKAVKERLGVSAEIASFNRRKKKVSSDTGAPDVQSVGIGSHVTVSPDSDKAFRKESKRKNASPTLDEFWEMYLAWAAPGDKVSRHTLSSYNTAMNKAKKYLEVKTIAEVTPAHVHDLMRCLEMEGLKVSGVDNYLAGLQGMFSTAIKLGLRPGPNPFKITRRVKPKDNPVRFLTKEQLKKLLDACRELDRNTFLAAALAGHAGLRLGETANQRWEDIDFQAEVITIKCRQANKAKGIQEFRTKNGKFRTVPMKKVLADMLMPYRKAEGYVIEPANGDKTGRLNYNMGRPWYNAQWAIGTRLRFHDLRHTFASHAAQSGKVSLYQIKEWLGHSSIDTTEIYAHLLPHDDSINAF